MLRKISCVLFLYLSTSLFSQNSTDSYIVANVIEQSTKSIDQKCNLFEQQLKEKINLFIFNSRKGRFEQAFSEWLNLSTDYLALDIQLNQTVLLSPREDVKNYANSKKTELTTFLSTELQTRKDLLSAWIQNGMAADRLTPQQRYLTKRILNSYPENPDIQAALAQLSRYPEHNFTTLEFPSKKEPVDQLKVFTANILCFPANLNYYFGGLSPWKDRIEKLVKVFKESKAHILSLEEVWDPAVMKILVERLKGDYSFFVFDAGDEYTTTDPNMMGFSSGLFVASKIPFDSVLFTPFARVIPPRHGVRRGALLTKYTINGQEVSMVSTHMQHGIDLTAQEIRKEQLLHCYDILQKTIKEGKINKPWGFLAGDINICALTEEFDRSGMQSLFSIPYLKNIERITAENETGTDYFNDLIFAAPDKRKDVVPFNEILDYCIAPADLKKSSNCTRIPLHSLDKPKEALSDHQALITVWSNE